MDRVAQDSPVQKRRRVVLEGPTGFEKPKSSASRTRVTNFQPELVTELQQNAAILVGAHTSKRRPTTPRISSALTNPKRAAFPSFITLGTNEKVSEPSAGPRPHPQFTVPTQVPRNDKVVSNKRVLQPPEFSDVFNPGSGSHLAGVQLRPAPPLPVPSNTYSSRLPLFQLCPPPPPITTGFEEIDSSKNLRTISTTGIARATDLTTENGNAELAHIFLQDQHPEIGLAKTEWNLGLSPQKRANGTVLKGNRRFTRDGLASRAFDIQDREQTDLILWQKETEVRLSSPSTRSTGSHIHLRVVEILDRPMGPKAGSPRKRRLYTTESAKSASDSKLTAPGLAICRIISSSPPPSLCIEAGLASTTCKQRGLLQAFENKHERNILVVLSFPRTAPSVIGQRGKIHTRNPESFAEGADVHVWEPWSEVLLQDSIQDDVQTPDAGEGEDHDGKTYLARPFPLTLSLPRSSQSSQSGASRPLANVALICDRFVIMT